MLPLRSCRIAAFGLGLVILGACASGGSEAAQVATLDTSGGSDGASTDTAVAVDTQESLLAYASCMRDNGVEMADPTVDADGNVSGGFGPQGGIDPRSEEFQTAQEACGDLIEGVTLGGGQGGGRFDQTAIQDGLNEFTDCLRDEGLDVDDVSLRGPGQGDGPPDGSIPAGGPTGSDGGGGFAGGPPGSLPDGADGPGGSGFDPTARFVEQLGLDDTDPATAAALEVCTPLLTEAFTATAESTDTTEAG